MENNKIENASLSGIEISTDSLRNLNIARKWSKFLTIVNFIGLGFIFITGIVLILMGTSLNEVLATGMPFPFSFPFMIIGIIYLIIGVIGFIPNWYLFNFSTNMGKSIKQKDSKSIEVAFHYLMKHYRFVGILTIIILSLYLIGLIAGIIFSISAASMLP